MNNVNTSKPSKLRTLKLRTTAIYALFFPISAIVELPFRGIAYAVNALRKR